jgi:hypothetical protein
MPRLQKRFAVFSNKLHYATNFMRKKPTALCDRLALEPNLDRRAAPIHMDMRRLIRFVAVEIKPERADPHDCRH